VLADRGLAAGLRAHVRRLGADVTLAVSDSHRLPETMEAALYVCGRLLVDAVSATAGPVALTLTVSLGDVQLAATAHIGASDVAYKRREQALSLLGDRLGVLGGAFTMTSSECVTEIRCHVPLSTELVGAELP
jgi:signal transduction histidine kinase